MSGYYIQTFIEETRNENMRTSSGLKETFETTVENERKQGSQKWNNKEHDTSEIEI